MRLNGWQRIGNSAVYSLTCRSQRRVLPGRGKLGLSKKDTLQAIDKETLYKPRL
jgi:hypothetical protein